MNNRKLLEDNEVELRGYVESLVIQRCKLATEGSWARVHNMASPIATACEELRNIWRELHPDLYPATV